MAADSTPEEEVRRLERHYSVNPEGLVFARLADAYRRCGRRERALELLREGLERHPDYATGHLIQGRTLREEGRPSEAAESFRRVLCLDAENLVALRSLAELATERGDLDEARRWADRLQRADPFASFSPAGVASEGGAVSEEEESPEEDEAADPVPAADAAAEEPGASDDATPGGTEGAGPAPDVAPSGPEDPDRIPGEDGLASEIAAMADDGWWGDSPNGAGDPAGDDEVATETMAHLYAQQGLYEEAAEVYRRLLDRRPGDGELRDRLEEMERRAAGDGEPATAPESEETEEPSARAEAGGGDDSRTSGDSSSAREHFRNLLRGRARHGSERSSRAGSRSPGSGATPEGDETGRDPAERAPAPAEGTAG